ncbi:MAG: hypothetical protein ACREO8_00095 [Luteimonas sp.]
MALMIRRAGPSDDHAISLLIGEVSAQFLDDSLSDAVKPYLATLTAAAYAIEFAAVAHER